jgi:7,8-dihydropterin-6-yl-methyl-4-(beta-D-ribofuranosyl)aminobenzene 5'-phosphate synthase
LLAEWGLSFFIEIPTAKILFDAGHTGVYWHNAEQLKINLNRTDFVVLSHHHWDHTGGLQHHKFRIKKQLIFHPDVAAKLSPKERRKIKTDFDIIASDKALELSPDVFFLGQISRKNSFEKEHYKGQTMLDDSALALKTPKGTVVITGCSHSGICNICQQAKTVTKQKLHAVIGGFHLSAKDKNVLRKTIDFFKKEQPKYIYPLHCVDHMAQVNFHNELGTVKLSAGDQIVI